MVSRKLTRQHQRSVNAASTQRQRSESYTEESVSIFLVGFRLVFQTVRLLQCSFLSTRAEELY